MVPADDEHENPTYPEDYMSPQKTFREKKMRWKGRKKNSDEPARLTTLPKFLMHWATPVWIAAAGFLFALAWAVNWRGTFHWPSADAMKLCATIAGAGFAFSAWQQRSHDNVVNAKQAQATVEREDYWKRRDHIFQLLGSNNPSLRLGAVALLAELADSAADYKFLKKNEMQQLQLHIISTLCLQMRHEGLCREAEGTRSEHQQIQTAILQSLFERITNSHRQCNFADWSEQRISMTDTQFITPFFIAQVKTNARIILNGSTFKEAFTISDSILNCTLHTKDTTFLSTLTILRSHIAVEQLPVSTEKTGYIESEITHTGKTNTFEIELSNDTQKLLLQKCNIHTSHCTCPPECDCKHNSNNDCLCKTQEVCSCEHQCTHTQLDISYTHQSQQASQSEIRTHTLTITNCQTGSIRLSLPVNLFEIKVSDNTICGHFEVEFLESFQNNLELTRFNAENNNIAFTKDSNLITLTNRSNVPITKLCTITNNSNQISKLRS